MCTQFCLFAVTILQQCSIVKKECSEWKLVDSLEKKFFKEFVFLLITLAVLYAKSRELLKVNAAEISY